MESCSRIIIALAHVVVAFDFVLHHELDGVLYFEQVTLAGETEQTVVVVLDVVGDEGVVLNVELMQF